MKCSSGWMDRDGTSNLSICRSQNVSFKSMGENILPNCWILETRQIDTLTDANQNIQYI